MSRDLDTFSMDAMEEDPDDEIVAACCILLLSGLSASAVLLAVAEESKIKRSTWVKPYLRARDKYGVCSTLLPELGRNDGLRYDIAESFVFFSFFRPFANRWNDFLDVNV